MFDSIEPRDKVILILIIIVAFLILADIVAYTIVRITTGATPTVAGDVSKFGIGGLISALAMILRRRPTPRDYVEGKEVEESKTD